MPKKTAAELRAEVRLLRRYRGTEGIAAVAITLIRWGGISFIAYCGYLIVAALAGHHTVADIGIRFLGNIRISEGLAWLLGGGGIAYGYKQRSLRRSTIERLQGRNTELEKRLDPNRSSSQLLTTGRTRPEDER